MTAWGILGAGSIDLATWLTPLWLLGVGTLAGVVLLLLLWGLTFVVSRLTPQRASDSPRPSAGGWIRGLVRLPAVLVSRRTVNEIPQAVREGALWPVMIIAIILAAFGIVGVLFVREPAVLLRSMGRLAAVGTATVEATVPVSLSENRDDEFSEPVGHEVAVSFRKDEVRRIVFRSDQHLTIATRPFSEVKPGAEIDLLAGEEHQWLASQERTNAFFEGDVDRFYVRNLGSRPAKLTCIVTTSPPNPEVLTIPTTALAVVVVFLLYLLQRFAAPRLSAIALATYKSEIAQPLFLIIAALGAVLLVFFFPWIPYNTFGEDIKMLQDSGLTLIKILSVILAVWAASSSISEEIEGRTALTVLSKPIGRQSFILGKFLGIFWTVAVLFVFLGVLFLVMLAYKPIYDGRESSTQDITWQLCHQEMISTVPGLVLGFMETMVLASLSVAISTRLPWLANLMICFAIYSLGHLTPLIVQSSMGQFVFVQFFGQLIATIFPNLDHFSIEAAVAADVPVPPVYLLWAFVYCLIYSVIAMLLALVLFEDRDLA